jgi:adenosylcobinamide kinase/adenosylcobinamide-phosphate guanylyltransferase
MFEGQSDCVFLATATAGDAEMADRILAHQRERGDRWRTVEEPLALAATLAKLGDDGDPVLVDCLTLWLGNLMAAEQDIDAAGTALVTQLQMTPVPVVLVSNEVGLGIVPATPLGRRFRDDAGRLHQRVASVAQKVVFLAAGLPLILKEEKE